MVVLIDVAQSVEQILCCRVFFSPRLWLMAVLHSLLVLCRLDSTVVSIPLVVHTVAMCQRVDQFDGPWPA